MAAGGGEDVKFVALAINADATKREEQLKGGKLAGGLHEIAKLAAAQAAVPEKVEALAALHVSQHASRQAKTAIEAAPKAIEAATKAFEAATKAIEAATKAFEAAKKAANEITAAKDAAVEAKWKKVNTAANETTAAQDATVEAVEAKWKKVNTAANETTAAQDPTVEAKWKKVNTAANETTAAQDAKVAAVEAKWKKANKAAKDAASVSWQAAQEAAKSATEHSETAMREAMEAAELMPDKVQPSIVTISELSGEAALKKFIVKLGKSWTERSHCFKGGSADRIVTAYNTDIWELQSNYPASDEGRYLLTKLKMKANNMVLAYFSVHLPHKKGKETAYDCIKKAIKECCEDAHLVIIGGDWNMMPQEIEDQFKDLTIPIDKSKLAFTEGYTNKAKTAVIDNFGLISQKQRYRASFGATRIMNEMQDEQYTTHAPIWAEVQLPALKVTDQNETYPEGEGEEDLSEIFRA